jgi:hypothetical protein
LIEWKNLTSNYPMNCDQIFDVLTRGPFPTGNASDAAVERHLAACHECRELAEALQPAVQLFHEALADGEGKSLPGYRGVYSEDRASTISAALQEALAEDKPSALPRLARPLRAISRGVSHARANRLSQRGEQWRLGVALSLGVLVGVLLLGVGWQAAPSGMFAPSASAKAVGREVRFQPSDLGKQTLASLALPGVCLPPTVPTAEPLAAMASAPGVTAYACCLSCHAESSANRPRLSDQAALDRSCHVCHNY